MNTRQARAKLLELRQLLTGRRQRIDKHIHHRDEPLPADVNDRAIELENRETLQSLDGGAEVELRQIDHALARLDAGHYGKCETCGAAITAARLAMLPFATSCVACAAVP